MSGAVARKRRGDEPVRPKADQLNKKRKKQTQYHSDSDSVSGDEEDDFQAVDLLDSDLDDDVLVDDGASSDDDAGSGNDAGSESDDSLDSLNDDGIRKKAKAAKAAKVAKAAATPKLAKKLRVSDAPASDDDSNMSEDDDDYDDIAGDDYDSDSDNDGPSSNRPKSKRNDPGTFATSLQKILGTKLSTTRRTDPVLSRSADAREASRRVVDAALEEKARRQMRLERRIALEKGRVKDVLLATNRPVLGGVGSADAGDVDAADAAAAAESTATILATEKRLRKVAQRGVVQLFNAVRAAQVKASHAKKLTRSEGIIGMDKRDAKVTEMSRKGFLDLIASGGGGLKKGGLEEA